MNVEFLYYLSAINDSKIIQIWNIETTVRKAEWRNCVNDFLFQKLEYRLELCMFHVIYLPVNISKNLSVAVVWLLRTI